MGPVNPEREGLIAAAMHQESNRALRLGSLTLALLGFGAGGMVLLLSWVGLVQGVWLPGVFAAAVCGPVCLAVYLLARREQVHGWVAVVVCLALVSLPTTFFLMAEWMVPFGAASFITGPFFVLYLVIVAATGFFFNPRISILGGIAAAGGYLMAWGWARSRLLLVSTPDPLLLQDLISVPIQVFKAGMIAFTGLAAAGLAVLSRRLILRLLEEQARKERINRLFGQYVSPEVKDKIVAEKADVLGERKAVAVLFSDLRGFSTLSEKVAPDQLVSRLNEYFDAMVECITSRGGTVDKFIGDAVMAVFGGVLPLEAPCAAALQAAKDMRRRLQALNQSFDGRGIPRLENGVGMDFGEVLQGNIGSARRKDFTVIGDTVNTAARLEGLTKDYPQRILVTREFVQQLPEALRGECRPLGVVQVKGKLEQLEIFGVGD
jgi:class 3 adenylate cyclase